MDAPRDCLGCKGCALQIYIHTVCVCVQVLYSGKSQSLGIKSTPASPAAGAANASSSSSSSSSKPSAAAAAGVLEWKELAIVKSPRITQCSVGHDGQHCLLVADDGSVFFVGVARRGEDGESSGSLCK